MSPKAELVFIPVFGPGRTKESHADSEGARQVPDADATVRAAPVGAARAVRPG